MENAEGWKRVGEAVRVRRNRLGLTQEDVTAAGGPSHQTLRRLEHGEVGDYQSRTLDKLEHVLKWKVGVIRALLDGTAGDDPHAWVSDAARAAEVMETIGMGASAAFRGRFQAKAPRGKFFPVPETATPPADLARQLHDSAPAVDSVSRSVSLGRSATDSAPAADSVTASVRTGGPDGVLLVEPGTPEAAHFHEVLAAARVVWNLASTPAIDAAKHAMIEAIQEATELARDAVRDQPKPQGGD